MPEPVGLNGLLPGRGPGLGAPGRGAGATPPAWPGLAGPGTALGWPPSLMPAAGRSGCENGTCGTPGAGCALSRRAASPGPAARSPPAGCPSSGGVIAAGGPSAGSLAAGWEPAVGAAVAAAEDPLTAAMPPSAAASAAALAAAAWPANASLSLRTTGASIVDDAERTNSPISWSLAITALLSTPNSFASSYTRTFATTLPLLGPDSRASQPVRGSACSVRRQFLLFIAACSSSAHHNLNLSFWHIPLPPESSPSSPTRPSSSRPRPDQVPARYLTRPPSASGPVARSALGIARRRLARSKQSPLGCK